MTLEEQEAALEESWRAAGFHNGVLVGIVSTVFAIAFIAGLRWMLS